MLYKVITNKSTIANNELKADKVDCLRVIQREDYPNRYQG